MEIYQVKSGDTLSSIARDVLGDPARYVEIVKLNNIANPNMIFPGAQLLMPESEKLEPVVVNVARRGENGSKQTPPPPPQYAGIGFNLEPRTMAYLAAGALLLYLAMERK